MRLLLALLLLATPAPAATYCGYRNIGSLGGEYKLVGSIDGESGYCVGGSNPSAVCDAENCGGVACECGGICSGGSNPGTHCTWAGCIFGGTCECTGGGTCEDLGRCELDAEWIVPAGMVTTTRWSAARGYGSSGMCSILGVGSTCRCPGTAGGDDSTCTDEIPNCGDPDYCVYDGDAEPLHYECRLGEEVLRASDVPPVGQPIQNDPSPDPQWQGRTGQAVGGIGGEASAELSIWMVDPVEGGAAWNGMVRICCTFEAEGGPVPERRR